MPAKTNRTEASESSFSSLQESMFDLLGEDKEKLKQEKVKIPTSVDRIKMSEAATNQEDQDLGDVLLPSAGESVIDH